MDKRLLQRFIALADELHFGRAALRSNISQPGLSQQIQQLETQLQVQLVSRSRRHVALTRAGEAFSMEARKILRSMDEAVRLARDVEGGTIGQLVIGATSPALFIILPEIIRRYREAMPGIRLSVRTITTAEQEDALRRGDVDVGLLHPPLDDPALPCAEILTTPFDVVMFEGNPLARRREIRLRDLARERFILFPRQVGPRLYDQIISMCQNEGFSPNDIIEAAPAQSIIGMAACGIGVGFVASGLQHFNRPHAVFRRLASPAPFLTISVATKEGAAAKPVTRFLDLAVEIGQEMAEPLP